VIDFSEPINNLYRIQLVDNVAHEFSIKTALLMFREAVLHGTQTKIDAALNLLNSTVEGTSITMPEKCRPEDCDTCFFKFICEEWGYLKLAIETEDTMDEYKKWHEADDQKRMEELHKPQTWNAETLAAKDTKQEGWTLQDERKAELVNREFGENMLGKAETDKIMGKLDYEQRKDYDKTVSAKRKVALDTSQTFVAHDDWHLPEEEKRHKKLMGTGY